MKKRIPVILILLTVAGVGYYLYSTKNKEQTDGILVSGNVEITDADLAFKIAGRLMERLVSEGDSVQSGQKVALLDSTDLEQELALRMAERESAQALLNELEAGSRPEEIQQAHAVLERAKAEENRWRIEYERQRRLHEKDVISTRELESAELSYQTAAANVKEAQESYTLSREGPRKEKIEQARAGLKEADEAIALVKVKISYATLNAPMNGLVLSDHVEPGEYVSAGTPIISIGDLNNVWIRAFIDETDLGRVKVGQAATVKTDSYPDKSYPGKISFISSESEFTPKNVQTEKERVKLVYRIKINVPNLNQELKPGMPVDATINVH
jgi:HlyD family secretion protein